jgi:hypothetical protein
MQMRFDQLPKAPEPGKPAACASRRWEDTEILSRGQLIESILELNPGASLEFLGAFGADELSQYLNHLLWLQQPRTRAAVWVRPGDSPAVLARTRTY